MKKGEHRKETKIETFTILRNNKENEPNKGRPRDELGKTKIKDPIIEK